MNSSPQTAALWPSTRECTLFPSDNCSAIWQDSQATSVDIGDKVYMETTMLSCADVCTHPVACQQHSVSGSDSHFIHSMLFPSQWARYSRSLKFNIPE